jgi:hypothetical protein
VSDGRAATGRARVDAAAVFDYLTDRLQIDETWRHREADTLTWWAGAQAQRLSIAPRVVHGVSLTTLHIETDVLADVSMTADTWLRLSEVNRLATLSAYVADVGSRTVRLHASVSLTEDNWPMARVLALHAAALQVADAHAEAHEMADAFGASPAQSGHPGRGRRVDPDEMLAVVEVYAHRGEGPSPFTTEELARLVHLEPRPWIMAANEPAKLLADLEFAAGRPARLEIDAADTYPALGSGARLRLILPVEPDVAIAQRLNAGEAAQPDAHQLGAWCVDPDRGLLFNAFIPSAVYMPELLRALVYHTSARNEWARALLFSRDEGVRS